MIWVKYCKRCGNAFDQDTGKDLCKKCREEDNLERQEELE